MSYNANTRKLTTDEGKGDEEMIDVEKVDAENEHVNQEVAGDQLNDDAQAIGTADLATQKTKVPLQSSSISFDYATKFLNFYNIPSADTEIISMMDIKVQHEDPTPAITIPPHIPQFILLPQQSTPIPTPTTTEATISTTSAPDSSTLTAIHQRLSDLENEVKTLRNVDHSSAIPAAIKSEVPTVVKEYLGTSLNDTLHKDLGEDMGNTDEPPVVKADLKDWFKKPERPYTLDPEWNECKTVYIKPTQKWLNDLAKAETYSKTFDYLLALY
ncbi:hypothetical protein Tco_0045611 [Tanacetum coccineum]